MINWSLSKHDTSVLKGIAITAMLFHHLYDSIPPLVEPYTGILYWLGILGKVCVSLFLFCSGYGLEASYKTSDVKGFADSCKFVLKRQISFYFNYWVIFFIFVPITIFFFNRPFSAAYGDNLDTFETTLFFIQDIFGLAGFHSYNITWWFNFMIVVFYLIFPFISWITKKNGIILLIISFAIFGFIRLDYGMNIYQLAFVSGILWHKLQDKNKITIFLNNINNKYALIATLVYTLIILTIRMCPIIPKWSGVKVDAFLTIGIVLIVIFILRKNKILMKALSFLGIHATNIYLTHTFINAYWQFHWLHEGCFMRAGGNFIVLLSICIIISLSVEYIKNKIGVYKLLSLLKAKLS